MNINELILDREFENKTIKYVSRMDLENSIDWINTLAAFANCAGGHMYIGVMDNANLSGFDYNEVEIAVQKINNVINNYIDPKIDFDIKYKIYEDNNINKYIIDINVKRSNKLPVIVTYNNSNTIYLRDDLNTFAASSEQIKNLIISSELIPYDFLNTKEVFAEKDYSTLYKVYKNKTGKNLSLKLLKEIGFIDDNGFVKNGSLLFKDTVDLSICEINCNVWESQSVKLKNSLYSNCFKGNLLDILGKSMVFIETHMRQGFVKKSVGRDSLYAYPKLAIQAAIINAIVHRNYYITGSKINIDMYQDKLEIVSPGMLIGEIRNKLIYNVFVLLGLIEKKGNSFDIIKNEYKKYGSDYQPYIDNTNECFTIVLKDTLFKESLDNRAFDFIPISEGKRDKDYEILSLCINRYVTANEICKLIGIKKSSYVMSNYINPLIKYGLLLPYTDNLKSTNQKYITNKEKLTFFND